ncbi:MAG: tetratricopeptide repeat protein [Caulobacter sp.]|nr:tetratricopeptide repeat protein [Caulobacter sp.]
MSQAPAAQAKALLDAGRAQAALDLVGAAAAAPDASAEVLALHGRALRALGRDHEASLSLRRQVRRDPSARIGWYNLGAALGDLGDAAGAEQALREALRLGLDRPEVHLVLGRALTVQQRYDDATQAFEAALARNPSYPDAHRDLAQLTWMRTGDAAAVERRLDAAMTGGPADAALLRVKAVVRQFAGDLPGAVALLEDAVARTRHPALTVDLVALKVEAGQGDAAMALSRGLLAAAPDVTPVLEAHAQACLAAGQAAEALRVAERLRARDPLDQMAILLQSTALRLLGDPRAEALVAPDRFVRAHRLPTPDGWPDLDAFLADLAVSLRRLHDARAHPLQQSLRGGTQAQSLLASDDPAIRAFFVSAHKVVDDHIAWLGRGDDPVRARIGDRGGRIKAAWSVRLRPHGFHVNHFHPQGWLSSAFYVETPAAAVDAGDRQGWLAFGEPAWPTKPPLAAQHHLRPEPGALALFPSYMWHGTVPFTTDETRMTIAFDVVPG